MIAVALPFGLDQVKLRLLFRRECVEDPVDLGHILGVDAIGQ